MTAIASAVVRVSSMVAGLYLALLQAGCASGPFLGQTSLVSSYVPANVYQEEADFPPEIKRVALLPLSVDDEMPDLEFGRASLAQLLAGEFGRARQFELVMVSPEQLLRVTGTSRWRASGRFSTDYFERLRDEFGVQAVLLPELTQYRPYEPLAIGWRVKLVDASEPRVLWAVDEVFDARVPAVAAAARRYAHNHPDAAGSLVDDRAVLQSPRRFARYTASAVVSTLPARGMTTQELK